MWSLRRDSLWASKPGMTAMNSSWFWLIAIAALPTLVVLASWFPLDVERLRRLAVTAATLMLVAACAVLASPGIRDFSVRTSAFTWAPDGEAIVRLNSLSTLLLPFAAGLWLLTVAV